MFNNLFHNLTLIISAAFLINKSYNIITKKEVKEIYSKIIISIFWGIISTMLIIDSLKSPRLVFKLFYIPIFLIAYLGDYKLGFLSALLPISYILYFQSANNYFKIIIVILILIVNIVANKKDKNKMFNTTINLKKISTLFLIWQILIMSIALNKTNYNLIWFKTNISYMIISNLILISLVLIINSNIKSKISRKKLKFRANYDNLTQLANIKHFKENINKVIQKQTPITIIMLDIDYFKKYNDTYGHPAGDKVLRQLAQILKDNSRKEDLIARYGGEEFIIALPNIFNNNKAYSIANRLRKNIENYQFLNNKQDNTKNLTVSIGLSCSNNRKSLEQLIKEADIALYQSKKEGRNKASIYIAD